LFSFSICAVCQWAMALYVNHIVVLGHEGRLNQATTPGNMSHSFVHSILEHTSCEIYLADGAIKTSDSKNSVTCTKRLNNSCRLSMGT
jgi:hypothetical protein